MSSYLFICSIGPVQGFIAAARSSRDLAYGSWLLSELAKRAARIIAQQEGFDALIFPAPQSEKDLERDSDLSVANKVVAEVRGDPIKLAKVVEDSLRQFIKDAWTPIAKELGQSVGNDLAVRQLEDLLEFYWVAAPLSSADKYKDVRNYCEAALSARKATRNFNLYQGVPRFKSSIDGWREHVLAEIPDRASRPNAQQMKLYKLRNGELLSGVDLLKRWSGIKLPASYRSTGYMAALPFAEGLDKDRPGTAKELCDRLETLIRNEGGNLFVSGDYSVFFPSEVRAAFNDKSKVNLVLQKHEEILKAYAGDKRPAPYYALLQADGDFMGKTIDGQKTPEAHRELSQALSEFAKAVPKIIAGHNGVTVYAGGDDILAYLPLHTALACVGELAETFKQAMRDFTFEEGGEAKSPTISAGLVIVHHLEPLSDVLALARRTEKVAKGVPGKNALAIALNKRSGAERTIKQKLPALIGRLQTMTQWWLDGTLSKGAAYELERLAREMGEVLDEEALRAEAIRILKRKRESGGGQEVRKEVIEKMEKWLKEQKLPLSELAQEMIIANEFARAKAQAQGKEREAV